MKRIKFFLLLIITINFLGCSNNDTSVNNQSDFFNTKLKSINENSNPSLFLSEGLVSSENDTIRIMRDGEAIAIVRLGKPVIVTQAENEEKWGYYQFPKIYRTYNGNLIIKWNMKADSHTAYGVDSYGFLMSKDNGNTWEKLDQDYFRVGHHRADLKNGDVLQIETPESIDVTTFDNFPKPLNEQPIQGNSFFYEKDLPEKLQGVYLSYWNKQTNSIKSIHGKLYDPDYLRCTVNGMAPVVWWGDMKQIGDHSYIAGIYPAFYLNSDGKVLRSAISFYKSIDDGQNWTNLGKIPYQPYGGSNYETYIFDGNDGFTEPAFEILNDSTYICVMRTSSTTPMYRTFSKDKGVNWSRPEPFTPNGVNPRMILLDNGVLVLASGRPGIQLRLSIDGDGIKWTEPIEMMNFVDEDGKYDIWKVNCGYPDMIKNNDNSFYIVYSDFRAKNQNGEERNTILFRRIEVVKR